MMYRNRTKGIVWRLNDDGSYTLIKAGGGYYQSAVGRIERFTTQWRSTEWEALYEFKEYLKLL